MVRGERSIERDRAPPAGVAPMAAITARDAQRHAALQAHHRAHSRASSLAAESLEAGAAAGGPAGSPRRVPLVAAAHGAGDHGLPDATTTAAAGGGGGAGTPPPDGTAAALATAAAAAAGEDEEDEHEHFSHRAPWLRAFVLGANDGLVSVASLMLGVGAAEGDVKAMRLSGVAGLVAGALSMAVGEYISVSSQRDAEEADVEKERLEQLKGPEAQQREFEELVGIYMARGLSEPLAREVARELTDKDVIRAHARDELGIDLDALANPLQASVASAAAFSVGAGVPLLAGAFILARAMRILSVALVTTVMLVLIGGLGAHLGGARVWKGALRVVIGGWLAMGLTFAIGTAFGASPA